MTSPRAVAEVLRPGVLDDTVGLVTGAGSGIGRAVAQRLAALGMRVTGVGRTEASLVETAEGASGPGVVTPAVVDIRDPVALTTAIDAAADIDGLDLLVNNAGGQYLSRAAAISDRGWRSVVDLDLTAVFSAVRAAHPHLMRRRGAVVSLSHSAVEGGAPGMAHSVAARAGVLGLTRTLALEWAGDGIRLNCLAPGVVRTPALEQEVGPARVDQMVRRAVPLGRETETAEVAELIAFLASPAGRAITGQVLLLDGGSFLAPAHDLLTGAAEQVGQDTA